MANSKEINLVIQANALAAKPIGEIGRAVDALVQSVEELAPASTRGEAKLDELRAVAGQLRDALKGLASSTAILETFQGIEKSVADTTAKLTALRERLDLARTALTNTVTPTKALQKAVTDASSAINSQERLLLRQSAALEKVRARAADAGLDLSNVAGEQQRINTVLAQAAPAYAKINASVAAFAANQRKLAIDAKAASVAQQEAAQAQLLSERQQRAALNARGSAQADFQIMLERTRAAAIRQGTAAQQASTASAAEWAAMEARATVALRENTAATTRAATAQRSLTQGFSAFRDEGRTTLSLYQRLRGEVLGLTTSFLGFYTAIRAVGAILQANQQKTQAQNTLAVAFGLDNVGQQMIYVRQQAERLGFGLADLAIGYGRFAVAATKSGASVAETRFIFETFSEVARVLNKDAQSTGLIFTALEQIFSKGTIRSEEFMQQLGDQLPGALGVLAKSIGKTTQETIKMLQGGQLSSKTLILFAEELRKQYGDRLPAALQSTQARLGRFQTAVFDLKNAIFEGDFGVAFGGALDKATTFFKSQDGAKFAQGFSTALAQVAKAFVAIIGHLDTVKVILEIVALRWAITFGIGAVTQVTNIVRQMQALIVTINTASANLTTLGTRLGALGGVLAAGFAGFQLGRFLDDNFAAVHNWGADIVRDFLINVAQMKAGWQHFVAFITHPFQSGEISRAINKELADTIKKLNQQFADQKAASRAGTPGTAAAAAPDGRTSADQIAKEAQAAADAIAQGNLNALDKASQAIQDRLSELRGSLLKKDATTVAQYVKGIREGYAPLFHDIAQLKKDFGAAAAVTVKRLTGQLEAIIKAQTVDAADKFNLEKVKKDEQEINDLISERNDAIATQNALKQSGVQSDERTRTNIAKIGNEFNAQITERIKTLQAFLDQLPKDVHGKLQREGEKLKLLLATLFDRPLVDPVLNLKKQTDVIGDQLQLRDKLIEAAKAYAKINGEDQQTTLDKIKAIRSEYEGYVNLAKSLIKEIETSNKLTDDQKVALRGVKAELEIIVAKQVEVKERIFTVGDAAHAIADGVSAIADGFIRAAVASGKLSDGITGAWQAFKQFAADFLLKIAQMILQQAILKALQNSGAPEWLSAAVSGAASLHTGGFAGDARPQRRVPTSTWTNAMRLHSGGMPGLKRDEVPAILQRGEEVIAKGDPRNARSGAGQGPLQVKLINLIDSASVVREGLSAPGNEKVIFNMIRANRTAFRQALA